MPLAPFNYYAMFENLITDTFLLRLSRNLNTTFSEPQKKAVRLLAMEADAAGVTDINQFAYILGTCWHECTFKSIKEIRAKEGTNLWRIQNRYWLSGYYGRGYSQLTWRNNYKKFSPIVGLDLRLFPDAALKPEIGAKILVRGMVGGLFSGVSLSKYFPAGGDADWIRARRIVNGNDRAEMVATKAKKILAVLLAAQQNPV